MRDVRIDQEGRPCFERSLASQLGLRLPDLLTDDVCIAPEDLYPGARVELHPGTARIHLTLPEDAFDPASRGSGFQQGGRAAILNYSLFARRFQANGTARGYVQAQLEPGFNIDNWVFRSQSTYTRSAEGGGYRQQAAYVQRSVESVKSLLQAGEINGASDGFGGIPILGAQMFSDNAQVRAGTLTVPIQGIAETYAVVELRQRGQLVYRTVVAPGPFSLSDIGALTSSADIEVRVIEEDGRTSRFTLPAPMSSDAVSLPSTYHVGMGRYRSEAYDLTNGKAPWLAYADYAFNLGPKVRLSQSALVANNNYLGVSTQATFATTGSAWFGANVRVARAAGQGVGYEWQVQGSSSLGHGFAGGLSWQKRSRRFMNFEETIFPTDDQAYAFPSSQSLSASLNWSSLRWGAFGYSLSHSRDANGSRTFHSFSTSRKVGRASLNFTFQKGDGTNTAAYLSISMPLGQDFASARFYRRGDAESISANYQGRLTQDVGYQIGASASGEERTLTASAQARTAYAQWSGGMSQTNAGARSMYGMATGSAVLMDDRTIALGASKVADTFAVVKVADVDGVRMTASSGSARTSAWGTALLPAIYPYRQSRIQVDGKSLPLNYRLDTTAIDLNLARGSVTKQSIGAAEMRQLMLQVRLADGSFASVGTSVLDGEGQFMGTVIGEGNVVLTNTDIGKPVFLESSGGRRCEVEYSPPKQFDPDVPYEEVPATCS